ncbi:sigma-70 family RNA polymerase sigma factor [Macrococcus lamae]|uniref:Sigma-70 family RNA polymerase sigma factor n=1 Tax=Macrococcus lamae TaxID=198484 RepID=A0A4R6BUP4_9STAP|nr:sigma-70 family RNA polymerase sigma factor [Macrococcus lamae]TDM12023.1 sigma-70 family RNA polymerase sigma factor [Macrococcus lamae]
MFKALTFILFETEELYETKTDEELVAEIKCGSEQSFELLVVRMRLLILTYLSRHSRIDGDELYQEALILLYHAAIDYDSAKCDTFKPYYLRLLQYRIIDWIRKEKQRTRIPVVSLDAPLSADEGRTLKEELGDYSQASPESISIYKELSEQINPVTLGLSPLEYRMAKHLLAGLTLSEISILEDRAERIVRNAHQRLKQKVLSHLMR